MRWLREAITDGDTQCASSARIVMLVAGITLSICTLMLTIMSYWRIELVPALTVFGGALAGQAGAGYVTAKLTAREKKNG